LGKNWGDFGVFLVFLGEKLFADFAKNWENFDFCGLF
jgi:hypothetical protein